MIEQLGALPLALLAVVALVLLLAYAEYRHRKRHRSPDAADAMAGGAWVVLGLLGVIAGGLAFWGLVHVLFFRGG